MQNIRSKEPSEWGRKPGGRGVTQDVGGEWAGLRMAALNSRLSCGVAARQGSLVAYGGVESENVGFE